MSGHTPWSEIKRPFKTQINYPPLWMFEGETVSYVHYNQLLRLLIDIRESLWELQITNGMMMMKTNDALNVDHETLNITSLKDDDVIIVEPR